jgi:hypothetical protein
MVMFHSYASLPEGINPYWTSSWIMIINRCSNDAEVLLSNIMLEQIVAQFTSFGTNPFAILSKDPS